MHQCVATPRTIFGGKNRIIEHHEKTQGSTQHIQKIHSWAIASQNRRGFDFSSSHTVRSRKTILKDIHDRFGLPDNKFDQHVISWLPGNIPTQLSIRRFKNALNSLLSNLSLARENFLHFQKQTTVLTQIMSEYS